MYTSRLRCLRAWGGAPCPKGPKGRGVHRKKSRGGALGPPHAADSQHTFAALALRFADAAADDNSLQHGGCSWQKLEAQPRGRRHAAVRARKGQGQKQFRLPADPETRIAKVSEAIDVAVDLLPQVLLDALRSSGAFLHSNCVPCVELFLLLPCQVLSLRALVVGTLVSEQVHPAAVAIFCPCTMMVQLQVRSFRSVHQTPRIRRASCPIVRAKHALTSISCASSASLVCRAFRSRARALGGASRCNAAWGATARVATARATTARAATDRAVTAHAATARAASARAAIRRAAIRCSTLRARQFGNAGGEVRRDGIQRREHGLPPRRAPRKEWVLE